MTSIRPNLPKLLVPLAAFALTLVVLVWFVNGRDVGLPSATAGSGVEIPPAASAAERIALLQRAARDGDADAGVLASLGQAYLQRARETGDPGFYSRAGRSFGAALRRDARNVDAVHGAATL